MDTDEQLSRTFIIKNKLGLHARAAATLVKTTSKFSSDIKIIKDGVVADGKSILGILSFAASRGTTIKFVIKGDDAEDAMRTIDELIESGFGEGIETD